MSTKKSNVLIQKIKQTLTSLEQKLLNLVITKVNTYKLDSNGSRFVYINLENFLKEDLGTSEYTNFTYLRKVLEKMGKKQLEFIEEFTEPIPEDKQKMIKAMILDNKLDFKSISDYTSIDLKSIIIYAENNLDLTRAKHKEMELLKTTLPVTEKKETRDVVTWFAAIRSTTDSKVIRIEISETMYPYYFDVNKNYTLMNALDIYKLKNKYSIILYELMNSYKNLEKKKKKKTGKKVEYQNYREKIFIYQELRELLNINNNQYKKYNDFKKKVLDTAKNELINKKTDIWFDYEVLGRGKGKSIIFKIYNAKKQREIEQQKAKEKKINSSDKIDKQIYTDIEKALKDGGVSKSVRNSLISDFDEMRIRRNIEMQYTRLTNKKITRKELPGALVKSIKEDWAMGIYEENKERKQSQEESKNTFNKPLTFENDKKEKTIDHHKKELKDNPFLYRDFLDFLDERAKIKPDGYIASILPTLENDQTVIDYEANLWPIINVFFGTRK